MLGEFRKWLTGTSVISTTNRIVLRLDALADHALIFVKVLRVVLLHLCRKVRMLLECLGERLSGFSQVTELLAGSSP